MALAVLRQPLFPITENGRASSPELQIQIGDDGEKVEARTHNGALLSPLANGTVGRGGNLAEVNLL